MAGRAARGARSPPRASSCSPRPPTRCASGSRSGSAARPPRSPRSPPSRACARGCCTTRRSRPAWTRSRRPSPPPTGWRCCSSASTSCRCATTTCAATRARCSARSSGASTGSRTSSSRARTTPPGPSTLGEAEGARAAREREFGELFRAHDRMLGEAGMLDFGDLVLRAFRLLREKPHVRARLAGRYGHVLVDDLQDTSFAQGLLLRLLVGRRAARSPPRATTTSRSGGSAARRRRRSPTSRRSGRRRGSCAWRSPSARASGSCARRPPSPSRSPGRLDKAAAAARRAPRARSRSGPAPPSAPRRRRSRRRSSGWWRARTSRPRTSACSCAPCARRARRSRSRSRSAPCPTGWRAPRRSSSARRCATCWPGCGCSWTRATPARSCARSRARPSSCGRSTSRA